ncbi:membrane protein [Photobacterium kishitanii]|uniref:Iron transporter n=1 Tax=Photobacterium kishitanii TaxID=318456 RepID=A0AAX0YYG6_9GAMM|nr:iron transporter [Photobacterium kishitanii]KJG10899.1 membrane protein [Photobacterium kishitanii]KJG59906.1 membrane protein [Photobacterium kishitanii]KJG63187.1 membrane protein [Photobacterium kishitanii]KJG67803.1 membrane protein [Photobacterium kishitanii]KJG71359.1 membrane protein [Photobacterium kishitanii]
MKKTSLAIASTLILFSATAISQEYPLGQPTIKDGMEIQGVYLQPITMDMGKDKTMTQLPANKADIHLEADIHAVEENPNGFAEGDWIPYLTIKYSVTKLGDKKEAQSGMFMPMVASDGPHYGKNIKLDGNGKYKVVFTIYPPSYNKNAPFFRHIDKETGVAPWFKPFDVSWEFNYAGVGRKGSY